MLEDNLIAIAARESIEPNVVFLDPKTNRRFMSPDIPRLVNSYSRSSVGFSSRGSFLYTPKGVWRTSDWVQVLDSTSPYLNDIFWNVSFSYDDAYACVCISGGAALYNTNDWSHGVALVGGHRSAAFSPDGTTLAAYSGSLFDASISFYSVPDGELIQKVDLPSHPLGHASYTDYFRALRYSPSQPYIMFLTSDDRFGVYSLVDFSMLYLTYEGEGDFFDVNRSGTRIAMGGGSTRLITVLDGTTLTPVSGAVDVPGTCRGVTFLDNDRHLLVHDRNSDPHCLLLFETTNWAEINNDFLNYISHVGTYVGDPAYVDQIAACDATGIIKSVSGVIKDRYGQPCQRLVYAISRETPPVIVDSTLSDPATGAYELRFLRTHDVIFVAVAGDYENGALVTPDVGFNLERPVCLTG